MHSQLTPYLVPFQCQPFSSKSLRRIMACGGITLGLICSVPLNAKAQFRPDRPDFFERGQDQLEQEIDRLQQQQPDSIPVLDVDVDMLQWSAVVLREGETVVWMPQGITSHETQTVESVDGNIDFNVIATSSALGRFVVAFSGADVSFADADPNDLLNRVQNRIVGDQTGFGAVGAQSITVNNTPGREFTLQNDDEVIFFRVLLVDGQLYVMAVNQPKGEENEEAIATFFESFQSL